MTTSYNEDSLSNQFLQHFPDGLVLIDTQTGFVERANLSAEKLLNDSSESLVGQPGDSPTISRVLMPSLWQRIFQDDSNNEKKHGSYLTAIDHMDYRIRYYTFPHGQREHLVLQIIKHIEAEYSTSLSESVDEHYAHYLSLNILNSIPALVYVVDPDSFEILFLNRYAQELHGGMPGSQCWTIFFPEQSGPCEFCNMDDWKSLPDRGAEPLTREVYIKQQFSFHVRDRKIPWNDGRQVRLSVLTDITEKNQLLSRLAGTQQELKKINHELEERVMTETARQRQQEVLLIQQSRNAAMGEMIGAIAHQWKQPLNALALTLQDLQDAYTFEELDEQYMNKSIKESMGLIDYMSETIQVFRDYLKPNKSTDRMYLCDEIQRVIDIVGPQFRNHGIVISMECEDPEAFLMANSNEFKQAIMNLITNARDAIWKRMEDEKRKLMAGEIQRSSLRKIGGNILVRLKTTSDAVMIRVADDGPGIPEKYLKKIFEPYFTTHSESGGTGLGLYMCHMIIEDNLKGSLRAYNEDSGAVFEIILPQHHS